MAKQRIIFVNLHSDWMLLRVAMVYIFKYSAAIKHEYLLKYLLQNQDKYEVCSYINDRGFSLYTKGSGILIKFINLFSHLEHVITLKKNNISNSSIKVIKNPNEIKQDDIIILYNVLSEQYRGLENVKGFKVLSMLHFHGRANENSLIKNANIDCYFNEVNLSKTSEIFRKYYNVDKPWIVHPFVFGQRFKILKNFKSRKNKAFSVGTITYKNHPEFLSVYGDPCDQPIRKLVKDNQEFFSDTIDCYSEDYLEDVSRKTIKKEDNCFIKLYKKIYNRTHVGKQKKYFSFNMVEKFNEYKMHIVGEEIIGVPGIGFVEGMACGSAYIGIDSPMYRDLGLIPGVHYISYDGSKEGLKNTIEYYQKSENQDRLEQIANTGSKFVREKFNGMTVAKYIIDSINQHKENNHNN